MSDKEPDNDEEDIPELDVDSSEEEQDDEEITEIACANCMCDVIDVNYIECAECETVICAPCFSLGAEVGPHRRSHSYRVVRGLDDNRLPGQWNTIEEGELIDAAHTSKLGNWHSFYKNESKRTPSELSAYFDKFFVRGLVGKFGLNEGFWMRDRHKLKKHGMLQSILNDKEKIHPILYNLFLAAMRWKKSVRWKANDPKLEEKLREAAQHYINYEFDIEGRELLGCFKDDYFYGGDLHLPEPIKVAPEFEAEEQDHERPLLDDLDELIQKKKKNDKKEKEMIEEMLQRFRGPFDLRLLGVPLDPGTIERYENMDRLREQAIAAFKAKIAAGGIAAIAKTEDESSAQSGPKVAEPKPSTSAKKIAPSRQPAPAPAPSKPSTPSPLKLVLKKVSNGSKSGYIVAKSTLDMEREPSPVNLKKRAGSRRTTSSDSYEDSPQPETSKASHCNGYHRANYSNGVGSLGDVSESAANDTFPNDSDEDCRDLESDEDSNSRDEVYSTPVYRSEALEEENSVYNTPEEGDDVEEDLTITEEEEANFAKVEVPKKKHGSDNEAEENDDEDDFCGISGDRATLNSAIRGRKQRRKKKVVKSKKLRRMEAFYKRETTKSRKREKKLEEFADIIDKAKMKKLRAMFSELALYRREGVGLPPRPKYKVDDMFMLAYNPERNEFETESFNDAETMISELQIGPLNGRHPMTDAEQITKLARIYRYKRALQVRNARKTAIVEHDKISEFVEFMKTMTLEKRKASEVLNDRTDEEKLLNRSQQSLTRQEYEQFVASWEKFCDFKEKILALQKLQKEGVTSLKGVELPTRKKKEKKKNAEAMKKAEVRFKALQRQHKLLFSYAEE